MEKDKFVLITGASSGIGLDTCKYLIDRGFNVIGSVRKQEDKDKLENIFP